MSQEARMRALIDDAVAQATAALEERLEAVEARLAASGADGGPTPAQAEKRAPAARTAKPKAAQGGDPSTAAK